MAVTTVKIDGNDVSPTASGLFPSRLTLRLGGISTLTLVRQGGSLPPLPDPWLGKPIELRIDGILRFVGDITDADPQYSAFGWIVNYQCRDLRARGDRVPFTDSNTTSDTASWNLEPDDSLWQAPRSGRTVGQILSDALTMTDNAANLNSKGIGGYVSLSPPTLPFATLADLAELDLIPPAPITIGGEKLLGAIESFLSAWAPNHALHVRPDGVIRFLDQRSIAEKTLTYEVDLVEPSPLSRSVSDCFQRVVVRGQSIAEPKLPALKGGGLAEDFAYGDKSNSQAKAAWTPDDFLQDSSARSAGTATCTDTTTVVLTSNPASQTWGANEFDQTNRQGVLYLWDDSIPGVDQYVARRIVANTAKSDGGTCTVTLDAALPSVSYGNYLLYGVSSGASFVYRKYRITDPDLAAAVARQFTHPVPFIGSNGDVATLTSYPIGSVCWSADGNPPYSEAPVPFSIDQAAGVITFSQPTYIAAGNQEPADVRALLAVNTGSLRVQKPTTGWEGTSHSIDGLEETLVVTVPSWRDPANTSRVAEYAQDLLDSVKDSVVEGSVVYHGLYEDALDFGIGLSITGSTYATGWENLNVPVVEVEVSWRSGSASHHVTSMRCSNRRSHYSSGAFLRPDQATVAIGDGAGLSFPAPKPTANQPESFAEREGGEKQGGETSLGNTDYSGGLGDFGDMGQATKPYKPRTNADRIAAAKAGRERRSETNKARLDKRKAGNQARLDRHKARNQAQADKAAERRAGRPENRVGPPKPSAAEQIANRSGSRADRQVQANQLRQADAAKRVESWQNQANPDYHATLSPAPGPDRSAEADQLRRQDATQRMDAWQNQADPSYGSRMSYGDGGAGKAKERAEIEARNQKKEEDRAMRAAKRANLEGDD